MEINTRVLKRLLEVTDRLVYIFIKEEKYLVWSVIVKEVSKGENLLFEHTDKYIVTFASKRSSKRFCFNKYSNRTHIVNPRVFFEEDCVYRICLQGYCFREKLFIVNKLNELLKSRSKSRCKELDPSYTNSDSKEETLLSEHRYLRINSFSSTS